MPLLRSAVIILVLFMPSVGWPGGYVSAYLDAVPELDEIGQDALTVTPASYTDWGDLFENNPNVQEIVLQEGDYTSWGKLVMGRGPIGALNGTAQQRRVLRYESSTPPWNREDQAEIVGTEFWGTGYWIISGLHVTGTGRIPNIVMSTSHRIVYHENLIQTERYGLSLRGRDNVVQRNYFQDQQAENDGPAIQIGASDENNPPSGNRILNNEVRNWNDGIVITQNATDPNVPVDGTIIDGNDVYQNGLKYLEEPGGIYAETENGLDFKTGTDDASNPIRVINNRVWGMRRTSSGGGGSGSSGAVVTNHFQSRNVLAEGNIFGDAPIGWEDLAWREEEVEFNIRTTRGTVLRNNVFFGTQEFNTDDTINGAVRSPIKVVVDGVVGIDNSKLGAAGVTSVGVSGDNEVNGVILDGTPIGDAWENAWNAGSGNVERTTGALAGSWAEPATPVADTRMPHILDWQRTILTNTPITFPPGMVVPQQVQ